MNAAGRASVVALLFVFVTLPAHGQTPIADAAAAWCGDASRPCVTMFASDAGVSDEVKGNSATAAGRKDGFPIVLGAFITAASADLAVSMYQIGRGAAREVAFGSTFQDAPVPFAVSKSALAALFALGVQRIHKDRPKAALILGISATVLESMLVVRAARIPSKR
jgi:hypothetical protein